MKNIILIGFMGVGKGSVGRELGHALDTITLDCDDLIESAHNCKVREIFEKFGEKYFREYELKLAEFLEKNVQNSVISTGGGFFKVKNLNKIGFVIYLKNDFEGILERLRSAPNAEHKFAKRPLLQDLERAKKIFDEREPQYAKKADLIVDVKGKSVAEIIKEIKKGIK